MNTNQPAQQQQLQVNADPEILKGRYANFMGVTHTKEEFILDFMLLVPPIGQYVARVVTSPGHMKRIIDALQSNLQKYEQQFGNVSPATEPGQPTMGFGK